MELPFDYANIDAEKSILAQLLLHGESTLATWIGELGEDHFRDQSNRQIFCVVRDHYKKHGYADLNAFEGTDLLVPAMDITAEAATSARTELYFTRLEHCRKVRQMAAHVAEAVSNPDSETVVEDLTERMLHVERAQTGYPEYTMRQLAERAVQRWEKGTDARRIYHLGIPGVDNYLKLRAGNTVTIVAPPKVGKTWLEVAIASFLATGAKVFFISAEMDPDSLFTRIASKIAGEDLSKLDFCIEHAKREMTAFGNALDAIVSRNLTVAYARGMRFAQLQSKIYSAIHRGFDVVILDYLQRIKYPGADLRQGTMEMSRELSDMAGRYEKLFIIASQANRASHNADFVQAHHAKESAAVEEDSDCIISLTNKTDYSQDREMDDPYKLAVNICQRNGYQGIVYLHFNPRTGHYEKANP